MMNSETILLMLCMHECDHVIFVVSHKTCEGCTLMTQRTCSKASLVTLTTSVCIWCYVYVIIIRFPLHIINSAPPVSGLALYIVHKFQ